MPDLLCIARGVSRGAGVSSAAQEDHVGGREELVRGMEKRKEVLRRWQAFHLGWGLAGGFVTSGIAALPAATLIARDEFEIHQIEKDIRDLKLASNRVQ